MPGADGAVFDEENIVSHTGLVPVLELAERAGLSRLLDEHVRFTDERVKSGVANSTPKLTSIPVRMGLVVSLDTGARYLPRQACESVGSDCARSGTATAKPTSKIKL